MITRALLLLLQLADSTTAVNVKNGDASVAVPIVFTRSGPLLRASQLVPALGARMSRPARDRVTMELSSVRIELTIGLPFARVGTQAAPLSSGPVEREGEVFLPMAVATEVIPRFVPGYAYDEARNELTRLRPRPMIAAQPPPPAMRSPVVERPKIVPAKRPLVVIDAGHGGPDRGMSGPIGGGARIHEADITLAVARRVRDELKARGVDVLMTRTRDTLIALADRGRIANRAGATLFLSIHVNAANLRWPNPRGARGFETYFLSTAKTEDEKRVEDMENDASKYEVGDDSDPTDPVNFIVKDMEQNEDLRESSRLATTIQDGLRPVHPGADRGVKQAGFKVLVTAHMPATLVEIGFGTNPAESAWLASAKGQSALADAIASATREYLVQRERRMGANTASR